MTENVFPFLFWRSARIRHGRGRHAQDLLSGGTARYRLYPTADGRLLAAAPIEQKFWESFCGAIDLPEALRDDARNPAATIEAVASLVRARDAAHWRVVFAQRDCCCTVVATLEEAVADPHVAARGLFGRKLSNEAGARMPALPVPIDPGFRPDADAVCSAPPLRRPGATSGDASDRS